ncbi:MAG TPA: preprotein translocase subunit YajC [Gammaproteobacteria bacterium]|nr:preprotein translocase subunit YajC [Gammaproteobacteria bacterium]
MSLFVNDAYAQAAGGQPPDAGMFNLIFLIFIFVLFYFLLIRPQQKRAKEHRQMVESLQKGDEIVTNGGVLGRITEVGEQFLTVEIAEGVQVKVQKHAVSVLLPKGTLKSA